VTVLREEEGLTLIEMLLAMVLMSLVVFTFYELIGVAVRGWGALEGQVEVQQQPRVAVGRIAAEVRQAREFVIGDGGRALGLAKVTVLAQDAAAGAQAVEVEDPSALAVGRPLALVSVDRLERSVVASIVGTTVNLTAALARAHRAGEVARRALTALSVAAPAGASVITVDDGSALQAGDLAAVGDEGPLTVTAVAGTLVTVSPALARAHPAAEVVQPLSVMFQCEGGCPAAGSTVTRCTQGCATPGNRVPLADLLSAVPGRSFFTAVATTLAAPAAQGATQVCVASTAGFAAGDRVRIGQEAEQGDAVLLPDRRVVTGIAGGCLALDRGLLRAYGAGAPVRVSVVEVNARAAEVNDVIGQTQEILVTTRAGLRN